MHASSALPCRLLLSVLALLVGPAMAWSETLRVVTYNVQADTGGANGAIGGPTAGPGLTTVLQAIGNEHLNGNAQPIDVLALQELYQTPATTLQYIVGQLNAMYPMASYAYDTTNDPTDGNALTGNGPSGLIYNTLTVHDLGAVAIGGTPSGSVQPRDPMRYTLEPVHAGAAADFYLYVSHAKSGTTSSDASRRNIEAQAIRTDAATLGPNAHIIYSGDYNITSSAEAAYHTMIGAGTGQAIDTLNPANNWTSTSSFQTLLTESATQLKFRDDLQLVSGPMLNQPGLQLVAGTTTPIGNNGSTAYGAAVNSPGNTALSDLPNQAAVFTALTTATDHLPLVADYVVVAAPEPSAAILAALAALALAGTAARTRRSAARARSSRLRV
jgi:hypothetical protein